MKTQLKLKWLSTFTGNTSHLCSRLLCLSIETIDVCLCSSNATSKNKRQAVGGLVGVLACKKWSACQLFVALQVERSSVGNITF